jgi:hypothetical protein
MHNCDIACTINSFDVRVFYPNAPSNRSTVISSAYRRHEQAKKCEYGQRVRDVEHGPVCLHPWFFPPLEAWGRRQPLFTKGLQI